MMSLGPDVAQTAAAPEGSLLAAAPHGQVAQAAPSRRLVAGVAMASADAVGFAASLAMFAASGWLTAMALTGAAVLCLNGFAGLYPADRLHRQEILRRRVLTTLLACAFIIGFGGAFADWRAALTAVGFVLTAALLQWPLRKLARTGLHRAGLWGTPTDFLGDPALTRRLEAYFAKHWEYGLIPAFASGEIAALCHLPATGEVAQLHHRYGALIVLADLPDLRVSGLRPADLGGAIGLPMGRPARWGGPALKRAIDLAIALPALVVAAPLVLLGAIAIWIVDPGPAHFVQEREGLHGRKLRIPKLRTMYRDAESRLHDLLQANPAAKAEWQSHFKLRDDPRVLPIIGRFLRVSSIDELPQLISVIVGDMSIVGPRPFPDYHLAAMPVEFRAKRRSVVPGITGLWQISARSDADIAQQQQLDEHYIDNQSIWLDLQIVLGTFAALIGRKGAY